MELKEGMSVVTPGGEEVGKVNRFVLDPATNEVSHIVIQRGWLLPEDKVVPFRMVNANGEDELVLSEDVGEFEKLPPFEETHFIRATDENPNDPTPAADPSYRYTPAFYWYPSQTNVGYPGIGFGYYDYPSTKTQRNIPEDTVALNEGADVISSDGEHVGDVERLMIEPESGKATHFLVSRGMLFKERKLVPVHWVKSVEEDQVHLVVPRRLLERLPAYQEGS
jgi:sporulation protein YlmC with PRC-barrel domain